MNLDNKVILLTGGTGSFGNKFVEIVLKEYNPQVIRIFSRDEKKQYDMQKRFSGQSLKFFLGDVRDKSRLDRAMKDVDIVVHAAALKQVPACEYNPIEAIKTNIGGAINVIDTSIDNNIDKILFISSDKAVHPVNLYGATKMVSEKLFVQGNSYVSTYNKAEGFCKFSCVRYGNVIGSRGSVIPLFQEQKETGTITVTDEKMTRFWLRIEDGVRFVIGCLDRMRGGEIFIPKIPSMKMTELANVIAPNAKIKIIGIRPGEKIHEVLITEDESRHSREFDNFFVIEPEFPFWNVTKLEGGKVLPEGFRYSSDNNKVWLTKKKLEEILK
jgi:UDP-N-acetylglucosamine 4,6-dehydratase (inverting)